MIRSFVGLVFAFCCAIQVRAADQDLVPLTVCEALKNRLELNGRTIAIQGIYEGNEHAGWLSSEDCPSRMTIDNIVWGAAILLVRPSGGVPGEKPGQYPADTRLRMTYLGEFLTRKQFLPIQTPRGIIGHGFGPDLIFPAQFTVSKLLRVEVLSGTPKR